METPNQHTPSSPASPPPQRRSLKKVFDDLTHSVVGHIPPDRLELVHRTLCAVARFVGDPDTTIEQLQQLKTSCSRTYVHATELPQLSQLPPFYDDGHMVERLEILKYFKTGTCYLPFPSLIDNVKERKEQVSPLAWACFVVASIEELRRIKSRLETYDLLHSIDFFPRGSVALFTIWKSGYSELKGSESTEHQISVENITKKRDGGCCILTGSPAPECCYIYPAAWISDPREFNSKLSYMKDVWGADRVCEYSEALNKADSAECILSLDSQVHEWFTHFKITLEPVESKCTATTLVLRYRPLLDSTLRLRTTWKPDLADIRWNPGAVELDTDPLTVLRPFVDQPQATVELIDRRTGTVIQDGYEFAVTTDDPVEMPLPNIELLRFHNDISRIISLAGVDEVSDDDDDSDSDISDYCRRCG
ncbi:hypothetical protein B0I35DRAFT_459494 [Stachybotrys elegans]|uniref:HNH nuclease domain-containing protein n=1 Tax=Stachybotrys elegans TaxID=80388 RepID=A0A8K0SPM7_9HYPO|nr:hypothetical protein B0I35DRAFT_459494 [Stachybotrys elegans]